MIKAFGLDITMMLVRLYLVLVRGMGIVKLEQLHYLSEAVKYKSISVAAEENFISQPSFSASITKLEKELGVTLLRRNSRGVSPTEAGIVVLEKTEIIFDTIEEMIQEVSAYENKGVVKLSSIAVFYNYVIPQIIFYLREHGQPFTLDATTAESAQIVRNVSTGLDNLGVIIYSDDLLNSDLEYVPLFSDRYLLYVGANSPYWEKESVTLEEALQQPYIAYREEFQKENAVWTAALGKDRTPNITFRTDDLELLKKMIAQGDYVAFFPEFMSQDDFYLRHGTIRAIPIADGKLEIEVGYIYNKKYKLSRIDQIFMETMEQTIQKLAHKEPERILTR